MKLLVWHWGRHGAGPVFATRLAEAFADHPDTQITLSLAENAELLRQRASPFCTWAEQTYRSAAGYVLQRLAWPFFHRRTLKKLQAIAPDIAICAMPALLDSRMIRALRRTGTPYAIVVHDAMAHPGDGLSFRLLDQRRLLRNAAILFALTAHVEADLRQQGFGTNGQVIVKLWHPPIYFGAMKPAFSHGRLPRLLSFGRLLPYKGLDLLADALTSLGPKLPFEVKICGDGPASAELTRLHDMDGVKVDHRWIPESELADLFEWSDAVVLPYREASQSGVAAAAIGQGRLVVATNVGGLPEQLQGLPGATLCEPNAASIAAALQHLKPASRPTNAASIDADWAAMAGKMLTVLRRIKNPG